MHQKSRTLLSLTLLFQFMRTVITQFEKQLKLQTNRYQYIQSNNRPITHYTMDCHISKIPISSSSKQGSRRNLNVIGSFFITVSIGYQIKDDFERIINREDHKNSN